MSDDDLTQNPPPPPPEHEDTDPGDLAPSRSRRAALKRKRRRRTILQVLLGVAAVIGLVAGLTQIDLPERAPDPEETSSPGEGDGVTPAPSVTPVDVADEAITTLLFGTREEGGAAVWMTLISFDPEQERASIVYIPAHTATEVPGRGLLAVGDAYEGGDIPLLLVSVENLLGISVDRYIELSDRDARLLLGEVGTLEVEVPADVSRQTSKDRARLVLVQGLQDVPPASLVDLLYLVGVENDDIDLGNRHLAFWDSLFETLESPEEVASVIREAGSALEESDASVDDHAALFAALADLPEEALSFRPLPVRPLSAGDDELYAVDAEELEAFIQEVVPASATVADEVRVQVLNGNGVPGIGQEVAEALVGEGFRVILSGNARRLDYRKTLIITYDESAEGQELAERAQDLLGVGQVQVSAQQQGIVDLTIVVGKDFTRAR